MRTPRRDGVVSPVLMSASGPWQSLSGFGSFGLQFHHGGIMGREVVRVPPGFEHPLDEYGDHIVGSHHEVLYKADPASRTAFQIYENVSEGTPVSPVFDTAE